MREPDFSRIRRTLLLEGEPDFVPLFDSVHRDIKNAFLGKPATALKDEVDFSVAAGYDFVHLATGLRFFWEDQAYRRRRSEVTTKKPVLKMQRSHYSALSGEEAERAWADEGKGNITTLEEFEEFRWPQATDFDYLRIGNVKAYLPPKMKTIVTVGGVYTNVWWLMGQEIFYLSLLENPELIERMMARVGEIQYECIKKVISFDTVGALRINDDIAYNLGTLVSPKHLRQYVFPWCRRVSELCKERDLPLIFHSDGRLYEVLDDIIDAGFDALHPIQPNAMDIKYLKERIGGKLCLMGNIDMDIMARGTTEEVAELVINNLKDIAPGGGYVIGASNSVTEYIPLDNYNAMRGTALKYGRYPISL